MIRFLRLIKNKFIKKDLDLRIHMFNVLAVAGIAVCVASAVVAVFIEGAYTNAIIYSGFAVFTLLLIRYASKSENYQICYLITISVIMLIGFPVFFFMNGAYYGAMPYFFVFAIVFTVFMLEGIWTVLIAALEIVVYVGICLYAYYNIIPADRYTSNSYILSDTIFGFVVVGIALGVTMFLQFGMYNKKQNELKIAQEEAQHFSNAKSDFLANMSHEIRTPLNVILGMNEVILRESDSNLIKGYSGDIQRAGKTLLLLINNVLDVTKIESGKETIIETEFNTAEFIAELSMIGKEQASENALSFETKIDSALPSILIGDAVHLTKIIVNFLGNAAKYTNTGGVTLSFSHEAGKTPNEILLCVSVADTGIGVREENLPFLFDAFTRADMPSKKHIEGTGLGLSIAKSLTELMGGEVFVKTQWKAGSVFSVQIPQKIGSSIPINTADVQQKEVTASTPCFIAPEARILVVDDNKENLQVMRSLLSRTLMRVDTADSGAQCLDKVTYAQYDIILMDYMMPEMDGIETLRQLRAVSGFDTPVVALTANIIAGTKEKLLDEGFARYLSKPVMWAELEETLLLYLPQNYISKGSAYAQKNLPENEKAALRDMLLRHGILLENGLHFLGGDLIQYSKLATFFTENFSDSKNEMETLMQQNNFAALRYAVHSLKSKAKAVGADYLSTVAAKAEELCDYGDTEYVKHILPSLYLEWERVCKGLAAMHDTLAPILEDTLPDEMYPFSLDDLAVLLRRNRHPDALAMLDNMIHSQTDSPDKDKLLEIRQLVDNFKFREAEKLLVEWWGGIYDEKYTYGTGCR